MSEKEEDALSAMGRYRAAVQASAMCARFLAVHDIPAMLRAINLAETTGPIFDPSLWIAKHGAMEEDKELLEAAMPLRAIALRIVEKTEDAP